MNKHKTVDFINEVQLFDSLNEQEKELLAGKFTEKTFEQGTYLFKEGTDRTRYLRHLRRRSGIIQAHAVWRRKAIVVFPEI